MILQRRRFGSNRVEFQDSWHFTGVTVAVCLLAIYWLSA